VRFRRLNPERSHPSEESRDTVAPDHHSSRFIQCNNWLKRLPGAWYVQHEPVSVGDLPVDGGDCRFPPRILCGIGQRSPHVLPYSSNAHRSSAVEQPKSGSLGLTVAVVNAVLRFNLRVADALGLPVSDLNALNVLMRRGALLAGELSQELHLTAGATTRLIDRLANQNLVERRAGEVDRRQVTVHITATALARVGPMFEGIARASRAQMNALSEEQVDLLIEWQTRSLEVTRQAEANLPAR